MADEQTKAFMRDNAENIVRELGVYLRDGVDVAAAEHLTNFFIKHDIILIRTAAMDQLRGANG